MRKPRKNERKEKRKMVGEESKDEQIEKLNRREKFLITRIKAKIFTISHYIGENEELKTKLKQIAEQNAKIKNDNNGLNERLDAYRRDREDLQKENIELKLQIERLEKIIEKIEKDRLRINKENQDLRDEIDGFGESIGNVIK